MTVTVARATAPNTYSVLDHFGFAQALNVRVEPDFWPGKRRRHLSYFHVKADHDRRIG
jgi:hypothetical protein